MSEKQLSIYLYWL